MRYRFTFHRVDRADDVEIVADTAATVSDVAHALQDRDPYRTGPKIKTPTLIIHRDGRDVPLPAQQKLLDSSLHSGADVGIRPAVGDAVGRSLTPVAVLTVVEGQQAGQSFNLFRGVNDIGRDPDADVVLSDPALAQRHARITIDQQIDILDLTSAQGVKIGNLPVHQGVLLPESTYVLGTTRIKVRLLTDESAHEEPFADAFVRRAQLTTHFEDESYPLPEFPTQPEPTRFPLIAIILPILMGGVLYAITRQPASLLFVAMSPLMMIGGWLENRVFGKRQYERELERYGETLNDVDAMVRERQRDERAAREHEHPSVQQVMGAIDRRTQLLWSRRPDRPGFLVLRIGTGRLKSRISLEMPQRAPSDAQLWERLAAFRADRGWIDSVPVVADLLSVGTLGVAGPGERGEEVVRAVLLQAAGLHAPEDVSIGAVVGPAEAANWDWLKWLPHTMPTFSPVTAELLADNLDTTAALITALEELIDARLSEARSEDLAFRNRILLLVSNNAVADRSRLVGIAERGPAAGIHVVWTAREIAQVPAAAKVFVVIDNKDQVTAGFVEEARSVPGVGVEKVDVQRARRAARSLAPVTDTGARAEDASDLPTAIPYLALADMQLAAAASSVVQAWGSSGSLGVRPGAARPSESTLECLIGQGSAGTVTLDLKAQGPHALVGGTTGAGKSELLQTWVLSMAAAYSPSRVTFLFVDYKGGSAFGPCIDLPHSVGLVTDLSPHLVRRVLKSLHAEIVHREHVLNEAKAKDLDTMLRRGDPQTPPSLVIVVDEFAALATDVPEFVEGVVNVAQRGRSLGLHLILATQRPAGVIRDNLRANTNLRVALRMADEEDSTDVIGTPDAAHFAADAPGRAAFRTGSARLVRFQAAYVGGHTQESDQVAEIGIREVGLGEGVEWVPRLPVRRHRGREQQSDLSRMVATMQQAAEDAHLERPRIPWLPELAREIDLRSLMTAGAADDHLVIGLGDIPERQQQPVVTFDPDSDGNLAIFGTGGSGKSGVLRTIAVSAGLSQSRGPVHIYGLDFASQGLKMLEPLPHVGSVITADDDERVLRLLRMLRSELDDRAARYAAANASTITEYRRLSGRMDEARILVLLDGLAAFRTAHDSALPGNPLQLLTAIAADGRRLGVHVVLAADRPATMPSALGSLVPRRIALRQADENDLLMLGVDRDFFTLQSPPGRASLDDHELQIAVLGGSASVADQSAAIEELARELIERERWAEAPEVGQLSDDIELNALPPAEEGRAVIGVADATLEPFGVDVAGSFIVAGPPSSGRTTALATLVRAVRRARPEFRTALLSNAASELNELGGWDAVATDIDAAAALAAELTDRLGAEPRNAWLVVVEGVGDFVDSGADLPLQQLAKVARLRQHFLVSEGDTQTMSRSFGLPPALRYSRRGIVLQPDQIDGDMLFNTSFPRSKRADYPFGRGIVVRGGRWYVVQVAH